jgi:hypothetical protein
MYTFIVFSSIPHHILSAIVFWALGLMEWHGSMCFMTYVRELLIPYYLFQLNSLGSPCFLCLTLQQPS